MPVSRQFLGWDRPLLELAGESLMERAGAGPLLDLSDLLVIVPTRNSGRRLREMLAHLADERGMALLSPRVVPPEYLLSLISEAPEGQGRTASPDQSLLAWVRVLRTADLSKYRALFPVDPVEQDFAWSLSMARSLMDVRRTLGEAGLELTDVLDILGHDLEEADRWLELSRLEQSFAQTLKRQNLTDLQTVRKRQSGNPAPLDAEVREIFMVGTPDPVPLALRVIQHFSSSYPVTVQVHAPDSLAEGFDAWGRPDVSFWAKRQIDLREGQENIHVQPHALAQANAVAEVVEACSVPAATITIGAMDEEVIPALERQLEARGARGFNPQGKPLSSRGIVHFVRCLRDLLKERSFRSFMELLRCPEYGAWMKKDLIFWDARWVLRGFDQLHQKHLPRDLRALRHFMEKNPEGLSVEHSDTLNETEKLMAALEKKPLVKVLPDLLYEIYSERQRRPHSDDEDVFRIAVEAMAPLLESLSGPLGKPLKLSAAEQMGLIVHVLESQILYEDRRTNDVEISGWLELPWDDAPHLLLTGFNDGMVPDFIQGDPWLPESLRVRLAEQGHAIKTNQRRYARDAYLLTAMSAWRREGGGRMEIHFGKRSAHGDPLRPSRLLFRCRDEELPARAERLFGEVEVKEVNVPWTPGFQLKPRGVVPGEREPARSISVTALRSYLSSPLHYYLQKVEYMEPMETQKVEMNAAEFGNFCHSVLAAFGRDAGVRHSRDEGEIMDFLVAQAEKTLGAIYGDHPTLPVRVQYNSIVERMRSLARAQAQSTQDGWLIERVELPLADQEWEIAGVQIKATIDRIDRHETGNAIRILDYKTSDRAKYGPFQSHLSKVTASTNREWLPDYACFDHEGSTLRWKDLQLPLYRSGLAESFGEDVSCGYFNLAKTGSDIGIQIWEDYDPELDRRACDCAEGIIRDILTGKFWPWRPQGRFDSSRTVHLGDPEQTMDVASLMGAPLIAEIPEPTQAGEDFFS